MKEPHKAYAPSFFVIFGARRIFFEWNESTVNRVKCQLILVIPVPIVKELLLNVSSGL